eukprot:TRINITY_DN32717_c0_g1_i2.p1 TRINITY_DN32717_c0_g1~~TRINITY_DN32717_c0_g1_i2.p1  ORF type:complete len:488 (+),score=29.41 TRINITY_DN32717_c0_g1_i2:48-1466(+)
MELPCGLFGSQSVSHTGGPLCFTASLQRQQGLRPIAAWRQGHVAGRQSPSSGLAHSKFVAKRQRSALRGTGNAGTDEPVNTKTPPQMKPLLWFGVLALGVFFVAATAGPGEGDVTTQVLLRLSAVWSFFARVTASFFQLAVAGWLATRLFLPVLAAVDLPKPVARAVTFVCSIIVVYGSILDRSFIFLAALATWAMQGRPTPRSGQADVVNAPPLWSKLSSKLQDFSGSPSRASFRPSQDALRLFDGVDEKDVRVTFWRDSASWCPYCMKTQLFLEERRIPYRVRWVNMQSYGDKPIDFLVKQPNGLLPLAEVDGDIVPESNLILDRLSRSDFEGVELVPRGSDPNRAEAVRMIRFVSTLQKAWMTWLSSPINDGMYEAELCGELDNLNAKLASVQAEGPFVLGHFSIVECHLAPILERMVASLAYFKGFFIRSRQDSPSRWPYIEKWFEAMQARPASCHVGEDKIYCTDVF